VAGYAGSNVTGGGHLAQHTRRKQEIFIGTADEHATPKGDGGKKERLSQAAAKGTQEKKKQVSQSGPFGFSP